jgi:Glycosyltransferase family 87
VAEDGMAVLDKLRKVLSQDNVDRREGENGYHARGDRRLPVTHPTPIAAAGRRLFIGWSEWRVDGRFAIVAVGFVLAIVFVGVYPLLSNGQMQDWLVYRLAGERFTAGAPLYVVNGSLAYAYPPPTAVVWAWGMTDSLWVCLKLIALASIALLFQLRMGLGIAILAVVTLPIQDDLILGNVMTFFLVGVMWAVFARGWRAAAPLGIALAFAFKPAIGPLLVWMALRDRPMFARVVAVAVGTSSLFALLTGTGRYLEYVESLPMTASFVSSWHGNLGLNTLFPAFWPAGIAIGYALTVVAASRLDATRSCAVALGMTLLAQPSLGLPYGVFLIPAVLLLWDADRRRALVASVVLPVLTIVLLPASAIVVAIAADRGWIRPDRQDRAELPTRSLNNGD